MPDGSVGKPDHSLDLRSRSSAVAVLPGLIGLVDTFLMVACAALAYRSLVIYSADTVDIYVATTFFVSFLALFLFQRAGLYEIDAIMRPMRFSDAVIAAMTTSVLFFLSIILSLKGTSKNLAS